MLALRDASAPELELICTRRRAPGTAPDDEEVEDEVPLVAENDVVEDEDVGFESKRFCACSSTVGRVGGGTVRPVEEVDGCICWASAPGGMFIPSDDAVKGLVCCCITAAATHLVSA